MLLKHGLRGEYITRVAAIKKDSVHSLEQLKKDLCQREAAYTVDPSGAAYGAWQHALTAGVSN